MKRNDNGPFIFMGVCLAVAIAFATGITISRAQQPVNQTSPYQTMLSDYRSLEGANTAATGAAEHFKASLQAALDQVVRDQQKAAADVASMESRLAWVLDNWVGVRFDVKVPDVKVGPKP